MVNVCFVCQVISSFLAQLYCFLFPPRIYQDPVILHPYLILTAFGIVTLFFFKFYDFSYITNAGKNNRNSYSLLVGMQNVSTHVKDSLAVSYNKTKHTLIIYSSSRALWYLSK